MKWCKFFLTMIGVVKGCFSTASLYDLPSVLLKSRFKTNYGKLEWIKINKATIGAVPKLRSHDYIGNIM